MVVAVDGVVAVFEGHGAPCPKQETKKHGFPRSRE
jgi:hypothetical protein